MVICWACDGGQTRREGRRDYSEGQIMFQLTTRVVQSYLTSAQDRMQGAAITLCRM